MAALDELVLLLEGEGSSPVRCDGATARGMLNTSSSPTATARGRAVEVQGNQLYLAKHRLPLCVGGSIIDVGGIDDAAIGDDYVSYRVIDRTPQDDGLMHCLTLDSGVDA